MSKEKQLTIGIIPEREQLAVPDVQRDGRGKILWNIPGKTSEENLAHGIRTMHALFFAACPEFVEKFPCDKNGTIQELFRQEAADYVVQKIPDLEAFLSIFGSSPIGRTTPYFPMRYRSTLQVAFAPLN